MGIDPLPGFKFSVWSETPWRPSGYLLDGSHNTFIELSLEDKPKSYLDPLNKKGLVHGGCNGISQQRWL